MISTIMNNTIADCPSCSEKHCNEYLSLAEFRRLRARLVLAAAKWRKNHNGENPPSLEALVPEYIATVPADPRGNAGSPVKYDAALGVVWSAGEKGDYDCRKVAELLAGDKGPLSRGVKYATQKNAFRLDAQPILFPSEDDSTEAVE